MRLLFQILQKREAEEARKNLGVVTTLDNCEVVKNAKIVILAVKPQFYEEVIGEIKRVSDHRAYDRRNRSWQKQLAWLEEKMWTATEGSASYAKHNLHR